MAVKLKSPAIKILIASPDTNIETQLSANLSQFDEWLLETATNWTHVLALLEANSHYAIILLDDLLSLHGVPKSNSTIRDIVQKIQNHQPNIEIVTLHSETNQTQSGTNILQAGVHRYLTKPFDYSELALTLQMTIDHWQLKQVHRRTLVLEDLHKISLDIRSYRNIPELVKYILMQAVKLVRARAGQICLLDEFGQWVEWTVQSNAPGLLIRNHREVGGILEKVIKTRSHFAKSNYDAWPGRMRRFDSHKFSAVAGAPIIWQDKVLGAIIVDDKKPGRIFTEEELALLSHLGNLAAVAIENAVHTDYLDSLMGSAFDAIIALDKKGRIVKFNQQAERILEYDATEVLGQSIRSLYYDVTDAQEIKRQLREKEDHKITGFDTHLISKSGEKIPIRLSASLLLDYENQENGSVGYFHDQRIYEASRAVASSLDPYETFDLIVEQAHKLTGASLYSHLALANNETINFIAAHPAEDLSRLKQNVGHISLSTSKRIGVSGRAVKTGRSQRVADVYTDPDYIRYDKKTYSELAVPIKDKETIIGVIDLEDARPQAFTLRDQLMVEALAGHAASAIQNARLYNQSQNDKKRLEAVARIGREVASSLEINQLLRQVCRYLEQDATQPVISSIRLYDRENNQLVFKPDWHESFHKKIDVKGQKGRTTQNIGQSICGQVAQFGIAINCVDVDDFPNYLRLISSTKSELCVPICYGENCELIGVLDVQSPQKSAFNEDYEAFLQMLADQLAVAIRNAKLFEQEQRQAAILQTLHDTGQAVTSSLNIEKTLTAIFEQALRLMNYPNKRVHFATMRAINDGNIRAVKIYPTGKEIPPKNGLIGIIGRTVKTKQPQLVNQVFKDPDYMECDSETQSELDVPIKIGDNVIGVINIEAAGKNAFNQNDLFALESLAAQAAVAMRNAQQYQELEQTYQELERTQSTLAARTAIAWTGMVSSAWQHSIINNARTVKDIVKLLYRDIDRDSSYDKLKQRLAHIERLVEKIRKKRITAPLSIEKGVECVNVNDVLNSLMKQLWWDQEPYKAVNYQLKLGTTEEPVVKANAKWLTEAFTIVIHNAAKAMILSANKRLVISTTIENERVKIVILDTGSGIPLHIQSRLFESVIHESEDGAGIGLLLAQMVFQVYGGDIAVSHTGLSGTEITIWLQLKPNSSKLEALSL